MELLVVIAFIAFAMLIMAACAPNWWIGTVVFLTFASLPTFVPQQIYISGFGVFIHEIPLFAAALYLLIFRPSNRSTDWCSAGIATITLIGVLVGLSNGYDIRAIGNDARGLLVVALSVFVVGRIASTPQADIALRAVKITLWISFVFILLDLAGAVKVNGRVEDASLSGRTIHGGEAGVERILGPTTHLATATVAIVIALWAIRPDLTRQTISYFVPAFGMTVIGYSRYAIVVAGITLLLTPLFHRGVRIAGRTHSYGGMLRALGIAIVGIIAFALAGVVLSLTSDIPGLDGLRMIYAAYTSRVIDGFSGYAQYYDYSVLYRQSEITWLQSAIPGHELTGNGLGFRYRRATGVGFTATSGTYYAHQFYWWAIAKVGWCGLVAYMIAFLAPVAHALFGHGRFALRSAAGAALVGFLVTNTVVPAPEDVSGAPVFGSLLGIALLVRAPRRTDGSSDVVASAPQRHSRENARLADS